MSPIRNIQNAAIEKLASQTVPSMKPGGDGDFAQQLMDVLKEVNETQGKAAQLQNDFMTGRRTVDYHDLMIALDRASTTLNLTVAVRNKLLDAYQEIEKMQV